MTGADHYKKAEELLEQAEQPGVVSAPEMLLQGDPTPMLLKALAHATLANAAAQVTRLAGDVGVKSWRDALLGDRRG